MDDAVAKAHRFVFDFRRQNYGIADDGSQDERFAYISKQLRKSIEHLSEGLYGKDVHFILELIQNAEDNPYTVMSPELEFLILEDDPTNTPGSDGCLCLFNNEDGFNEDNVESICGIGQSTKDKRHGYIGEKGIGFKSVFAVSAQPHIYSNGFRFYFKEKDPQIELAFIVPYWLDDIPPVVRERKVNTAILLPLKPDKRMEIIAELERIRPETILFLSKLEGLTVEIRENSERIDLIRDAGARPIVDLLVQRNGQQDRLTRYWLHDRTIPVPGSMKEQKREGVDERTLSVAFPLDSDDHRGRVFAFLPTEVESGLPFIVNADFILSASRETIQKDKPWNTWLRDALAATVTEGIEAMLAAKARCKQAYRFIPLSDQLQNLRDFFEPLCDSVCDTLGSKEIVLTDTGKMITPERARLVPKELRSLFQGARRPKAFEDFDFVDPDIQNWSSQLRAIGVVDFTYAELQQCLCDESWLSSRAPAWFLELYRYLQATKKKRKIVEQLCIVPVDGGGSFAPADGPVYYPGPREPVASLRKTLKVAGFPDVSFLNPKVLELLQKDAGLMQWAGEALGITEFSIRNFILGTLLPWAYRNSDALTPEQVLKLAQIFVDNWNRFNDKDEAELRENLPVVLDDGQVCCQQNLGGEELLVPRNWDPVKGWQLLLVAKKDYAHEDVLADGYARLRGDRETIDAFLNGIGAQTYPDLRNHLFHQSDADPATPYGIYVQAQLDAFPDSSSRVPSLKSWMVPSFFFKKKLRESRKHRLTLIHWLEGMLENRFEALRNGTIEWYYYNNQSKTVESGLYFELVRQPWVRTTKGRKRPAEIFKESKQISEMFGARLPYLKDEMSPRLIEFLGIHTEATAESIIDYLHALAEDSAEDSGLVNKLYTYLHEYGKDLKTSFAELPLIFVPESPQGWYKSSEVVWEDLSSVFGNMYVYLAPAYEDKRLENFFIKGIGVSRTIGTGELTRAWRQLAEKENPDPEVIRAALSRIMPKVLQEARSEEEHPEWWDEFTEEVQVWTYDDEFVPPDEALAGDDAQLRRLFEDSVAFVWVPDSLSHDRLEPLYQALGVRRLSEAVRVTLDSPLGVSEVETPSLLTPYSKRLLAYLLYNLAPERFEESMANDVLPRLLQTVEFSCESLVLSFSLDKFSLSCKDSGCSAFWDVEKQSLYLLAGADREDLLDEVAEGIARAIWGRQFRDQEDSVRRALSVLTEERFRKLHDKKGWHLPRDLLSRINELIGAPRAEQQETESDAEQDKSDTKEAAATATGSSASGASTGAAAGTITSQASTRTGRQEGNGGSRSGRPRSGRSGDGSGGVGKRKSRSQAVNNRIQAAQQSRIPVYVYRENAREMPGEETPEARQRREDIGEAAEKFVYRMELEKGHKAERMPQGHPGYDIEVIDQHTGELRFIEVKGQDGDWGVRGVGLSYRQFQMAQEHGAAYWLYIVERARSSQPKIIPIQNPVGRITEYRFDSSWAQLAAQSSERISPGILDHDTLVDELKSFTESEVCKHIIDACYRKGLDLPEVGYEFADEDGVVIGEVELAWPQCRAAVTLSTQNEASQTLEDWQTFSVENVPEDISEFELYGLLSGVDGLDESLP